MENNRLAQKQIYQLQLSVAYLADTLKYILEHDDMSDALIKLKYAQEKIEAFTVVAQDKKITDIF